VATGTGAEPTTPPAVASSPSGDELHVEVTKKRLGKEVVMRKGGREWYMLIEVTEGTSVVIRQEKNGDTYIVDESETHDEAFSKTQVDAVIEAFINGVKSQTKHTDQK
jgi:hypothetical protein